MSVFARYAQYYDLLYKDKDYEREAKYVAAVLRIYRTHTKTILDLGCGTGMHATTLARDGYFVHGIDYSADMIKEATQRLQSLPAEETNGLEFQHGDIRTIRIAKKFDAVISLFHVISYQNDNDDILKTFTTARKHLDPDGLFVFDCWYGPTVLTDRPTSRTKHFKNETYNIVRQASAGLRPNDNVVEINYTFSVTDNAQRVVDEFQERHSMRYFFKPEIEVFLSIADFDMLQCYKWLTTDEPGLDSWYVMVLAKAK